jgi:hypothetical protein
VEDRKERIMSTDSKNAHTKTADTKESMGWTVLLILLGMAALYGGSKWLSLLIPAALLVWYGAGHMLRGGRN